jgi:hypothetical protein
LHKHPSRRCANKFGHAAASAQLAGGIGWLPPDAGAHDDDPARPFHPHDDRIVSLGLHHTIDTGIAHDVIIDTWWASL